MLRSASLAGLFFTALFCADSSIAQSNTRITVNRTQRYQKVDGFGVSQAFQRAIQIQRLPPTTQTLVLDLLFSDTKGAGLTILRNGIGSTNNSNKDFMNTILPESPGSSNATPKYLWDGLDSGQVWLSKQAQTYGVKTFYADAWSAPAFMKTNNNDTDGGYLCGVTDEPCATGDWRQAYADYLIQYIRFYAQAGIKVTHVGFLNEPELTQSYASMLSDGAQAAKFLQVFEPAVRKSGLDVKIVCCEAAGWEYQQEMLSDIKAEGAEKLFSVVASHGYATPPRDPFYDTPNVVWQTEWAELYDNWTAAWDVQGDDGEGFTWAQRIQDAFVQSNTSAFIHWIGAERGRGNSQLIQLQNSTIVVSKRLWAFAQFSRFVKPEAVRIGARSTRQDLHVSAFENANGAIAIQVLNTNEAALPVSLAVGGLTGSNIVHSWLTNNDNDISARNETIFTSGQFNSSVPARSMVSFVISKIK